MEAVVSLEDSLAEVWTALSHYAAVFRRNRGFSGLDVTDAGDAAHAQLPDAGEMNFEAISSSEQIGHCKEAQPSGTADMARGCFTSDLSACQRFRAWTFPRAERDESRETDPSGLSSFGQAPYRPSGGGLGSNPEGFPFNKGHYVANADLYQSHGTDLESAQDSHHAYPTDSTTTVASPRDPDVCRTFGHVRLRSCQNNRLPSLSTPTPCRIKSSTERRCETRN
ncbi:hypothetical protein B0H13DRAFT_1946419 [Mycena leptocephala]|nr:hypothetical protein B0H13DRAFT_1946419 [Mycena leptocephala]